MSAEASVHLSRRDEPLSLEARLRCFESLALALSAAQTAREVATVTAREACLATGALAAIVVAPSEHGRALTLFGYHGIADDRAAALRMLSLDSGLPICRAFSTGQSEWFEGDAPCAAKYGKVLGSPSAALAVLPLVVEGQVALGAALSFDARRGLPEDDRVFVKTLLALCAQAFVRARRLESERVARTSAERLGLILEAGDFVARAGDRAQVIASLTQLVVPRFADYCAVHLCRHGGTSILAATRHRDDEAVAQAAVELGARKPVDPNAANGVGAVLRTARTEIYERVDDAVLASVAPDDEERRFLSALGVKSLLIVPLAAGENVVGAVTLASTRQDLRYEAIDARLAEKLASRAAFALDNARLIGELRSHAATERRAREVAQRAALRMRILAEASRAFSEARLDVHLIATSLATLVGAYLADGCVVMLVSDDGSQLEPMAVRHASPDKQRAAEGLLETLRPRVGEGLLGGVVATGDPLILDGTAIGERAHARAGGYLDRFDVASVAVVPLRLGGRVIGALAAERDDGPRYDAEDATILQDLADRAAVAFANARLHAAEQIARKHVERLQSVTSALAEAITPEQVASVILDSVIQELRGDMAVFLEPSDDARALVSKQTRNLTPELARSTERVAIDGQTLVSEAYLLRAPFFIESVKQCEEKLSVVAPAAEAWTKLGAFAALPLVAGAGNVYGVVSVSFREARTFSAVDRAFAMNLAEQGAQAFERARLYAAERAAKREAEAASRLKDEFLATVSHELRTPLNAILGWASLLRSGRLGSDSFERALATIERNARSQARLVDDVLDVSRIISGKLAIRAEPVDVGLVLQQAIDVVRPAALAKEVALHASIAPMLRARGDADRLQQVYWNVLFNAVKFTPRGGDIVVDAHADDGSVVVSIRDSGQGVRPEFLPHLFEPFRQADGSTTRSHGGLGLGLSIARRLIQLHGGEIHAASEGEGRGATFTILLPATTDAPALGAPGRSRPASRLRGLDVLVVDDDDDARELTSMVLAGEGADVRTASSAREAIARITERTPDLLVCDIGMPEEDGLSLLPRARALAGHRGERFTALAFTAYADADHIELVADAGFDAHVTKPVDAHALVAAVARLVLPPPAATSSSVLPRG